MINADNMPKEPERAATIILTRQHGGGELQVYLLKRSAQSGFMAGNYVFPGGRVDPTDWAPGLWNEHVDMDLEGIYRRLGGGLSDEEVIANGVAAIRETFEEAGVLLAYPSEQSHDDLRGLIERRMAGSLPKGWLRELVVSEGWTLMFSRLSRWAHWITPELRKRRYDTRFFLVFMPKGQKCIPDTRETTHGVWISPEEGLAGNLRGEIPLSPPAVVTLHELLQYSDTRGLKKEVKTRQWGKARLPQMVPVHRRGALLIFPWDPFYNQDLEIDTEGLDKATIPLGEPFSRLWSHDGIWIPVGH